MKRRALLLTVVFAAGAAAGWFVRVAREGAGPRLQGISVTSLQWGRAPAGGGWFVEAGFRERPPGTGAELEVEVFAYPPDGGPRRATRRVDPATPTTRVELPDPIRLGNGTWLASSGWTPGPAYVQVVAREDGRRIPMSDPRRIDLAPGTGHPGAFPPDYPTR
jgi:hypothetical protein